MGNKNKNSAQRAITFLIIPACGFFLAAVIALYFGYTIPGIVLILLGLLITTLAIKVKNNADEKKRRNRQNEKRT